jgi:hypothetical protein
MASDANIKNPPDGFAISLAISLAIGPLPRIYVPRPGRQVTPACCGRP